MSVATPAPRRLWAGHPACKPPRFFGTAYRPPTDRWDKPRPDAPPIDLYSFADIELRSDHMPYQDDAPLTDSRIYPSYVDYYYAQNLLERFGFPRVAQSRSLNEPVFCVTHFNMLTYGHFLMEVLPKLLVCRRIRHRGESTARIAFPMNLQPLKPMLMTLFTPDEILPYDDSKERLKAPLAFVPSVGTTLEWHDLVVEETRALARDIEAGCPQRLPGPRVFLSREKIGRSFRQLTNEPSLFEVASSFGFERVCPEELPWTEQIAMFQRATHVIGEFTSALMGTIFSRENTKVISLSWLTNDAQTYIAAAFGHEIGYILPKDGTIPTFTPRWTETRKFEISPDDLRNCLEVIT